MFTRIVTLNCNPGQTEQTCRTINDKVLPILKKQQGFLDEIVLVSTTDPNQVVAQSFWDTPDDAERYDRDQFPKIREMMQGTLTRTPVVETYNVDTFTTHNISAGKAA